MGSIMLDNLDDQVWLVDVPTKVIRIAEVIRQGDSVFIRYTDDKKRFRMNEFSVCRLYKTEKWAFPLNIESWAWQEDFLNVLARLKLVTPSYSAKVIAASKRQSLERSTKYDKERLEEMAAKYGFQLTEKQKKAMIP